MIAGAIARLLALPRLLLALAERVADLTLALPDAALLLVAVLEVRDVDLRQRDRDRVLALLRDHLALRDVLAQVLFDLAANDLAEASVIEVDLLRHLISLDGDVRDLTTFVDEAQAAAVAAGPLHHVEEPERPRQHICVVLGLQLGAQLRQKLSQRVVQLDGDRTYALGVHYDLTSPRAKIEATKLSTSVALTSS